MAQHDYVIANGTGAAVRSDLNNALAAIVSQNSGATAPATTYAYQFWADTTTNLLKLRNSANSAWITLFQLDGEWSTLPVENGTAAAPSIYFKDSGTDTGFYSPGTDQVGIATGGTARMTIDSNGNLAVDTNSLYVDAANNRVGVGTSSPGHTFHVVSADTTTAGFFQLSDTTTTLGNSFNTIHRTGNDGDNRYSLSAWQVQNASGLTQRAFIGARAVTGAANYNPLMVFGTTTGSGTYDTRMVIDGSGRVGIGTTSPAVKLDVNGDIFASGGDIYTGANRMLSSDSGIRPLIFGLGAVEKARIDSSGRLLVGTSTARSNFYNTSTIAPALQVEGTSFSGSSLSLVANGNASASTPYSILAFGRSRGTAVGSDTVVASGDYLGDIAFHGSDGTEFVIAALISAVVDGTPGANDMPGRLVFSTTADGASSPTERMRITSGGDIFLGPSSGFGGIQVQPLEADGTCELTWDRSPGTAAQAAALRFRDNGSTKGTITYTNTATAYNTTSDYRLKENVTQVTDGITRLQQLKPSRFNFIADPAKTVDGFLAHEVQTIVPEAITGEKDAVDDEGNPEYQGIDQSKLVPLLTAALQEAVAKIESLEARLTAAGV